MDTLLDELSNVADEINLFALLLSGYDGDDSEGKIFRGLGSALQEKVTSILKIHDSLEDLWKNQ